MSQALSARMSDADLRLMRATFSHVQGPYVDVTPQWAITLIDEVLEARERDRAPYVPVSPPQAATVTADQYVRDFTRVLLRTVVQDLDRRSKAYSLTNTNPIAIALSEVAAAISKCVGP